MVSNGLRFFIKHIRWLNATRIILRRHNNAALLARLDVETISFGQLGCARLHLYLSPLLLHHGNANHNHNDKNDHADTYTDPHKNGRRS